MGNKQANLSQENLNSLKKDTNLKQKDIKKIFKKFVSLDKTKKGYVSSDDISTIPEIEKNPLRYYICKNISENNNNDEINFESFIRMIDIFKNNKEQDQYHFLFNLLDFNKDGKIDYEDLLVNFKLLLENSLNEEQISEIVKKTISEYSSDQTYITFEEFLRILES